MMRYIIIFLLSFSSIWGENFYFQTGFFLNHILSYYKEAQQKEIPIQNIFNVGIPLNIKFSRDYSLFSLNQIYWFNIDIKEDKEVLYRKDNDNKPKFYLYHRDNTFGGIYYQNIFLLIGYINPYESLFNQTSYPLIQYVFPSVDFRIDLESHILTISPYFIYDKEQIFFKEDEEYNKIVNHYYIQEIQKKENKNLNKNYKLHYTFLSSYIDFNFGYYFIDQKNNYSNIKNSIQMNFYEYALLLHSKYFFLKGHISKSDGTFYKANRFYKIDGYKYKVGILIRYEPFYLLLEGAKTTKSKWNYITNRWEYFGYTSIFDEFLLTPQLSTTYKINPQYQICYNPEDICEGISFIDNENHFILPADTLYLKAKYNFTFLELILRAGYIKKEIISQNIFDVNNIRFLEKNENKKITHYLEPALEILFKHQKSKFLLSYSELHKKQEKNYKYISKNFHLFFIYYI